MEQPEKMGGNYLRNFLVGGSLNGATFGITISSEKHVSAQSVLAYFLGHGTIDLTDTVDLKITSIYEFKDEPDFAAYKAEQV